MIGKPCGVCSGAGRIRGIFQWMECAACDGAGLLTLTGCMLSLKERAEVMRQREAEAEALRRQCGISGPGVDYQGMNNRHRAGGGNWTGD